MKKDIGEGFHYHLEKFDATGEFIAPDEQVYVTKTQKLCPYIMMEINIYKNILSLSINEKNFDSFYHSFKLKNTYFMSSNGYEIMFIYCEESRVVSLTNLITIYINPTNFDRIINLFESYLESDRKFPLDISLEQLGFFIEPSEIKDVIFECGQFNG